MSKTEVAVMFRSNQIKFAHHALNTIRVFTQSGECEESFPRGCNSEMLKLHLYQVDSIDTLRFFTLSCAFN